MTEEATPASMTNAIMAAVEYNPLGYTVVGIDPRGRVFVEGKLTFAAARQMIRATIEKQLEKVIDHGGAKSNPRRTPTGRWVMSYPCADGVVRVFTAAADGQVSRSAMRRPLTTDTRFAVLRRDGYRCRYCGRTSETVELHVDHVVSVAAGGSDDMSNLATACQDCNLGKSDGPA